MSTQSAGETGTWLALLGLLFVSLVLLGLMALVMPQLLGVLLVLDVFLTFGVLHYLLWGWWLGKRLMRPAESPSGDSDVPAKGES